MERRRAPRVPVVVGSVVAVFLLVVAEQAEPVSLFGKPNGDFITTVFASEDGEREETQSRVVHEAEGVGWTPNPNSSSPLPRTSHEAHGMALASCCPWLLCPPATTRRRGIDRVYEWH